MEPGLLDQPGIHGPCRSARSAARARAAMPSPSSQPAKRTLRVVHTCQVPSCSVGPVTHIVHERAFFVSGS